MLKSIGCMRPRILNSSGIVVAERYGLYLIYPFTVIIIPLDFPFYEASFLFILNLTFHWHDMILHLTPGDMSTQKQSGFLIN